MVMMVKGACQWNVDAEVGGLVVGVRGDGCMDLAQLRGAGLGRHRYAGGGLGRMGGSPSGERRGLGRVRGEGGGCGIHGDGSNGRRSSPAPAL
ncbi:hypothetical protein TIFTF001_025482 [Ficus carica]|uniref:Uncharacterized protein n=1 Tax=Ficus carica TaxID=3494 RepID=A0AA88AJX8_FICCA|nr:hypothetical protein TIFTF001_025482 [Ficus carica]